MDTWLIVVIIAFALAAIIGNISILRRSAFPLRKKGLNDLTETLPRAGDKKKADKLNNSK